MSVVLTCLVCDNPCMTYAGVMVRLLLTLAPIACILAAIGCSTLLNTFCAFVNRWLYDQLCSEEGVKVNVHAKTFHKSDIQSTTTDADKYLVSLDSQDISKPHATDMNELPVRSTSIEPSGNPFSEPNGVPSTPPLSVSLSLGIVAAITLMLLTFGYHATYVASIAYSSTSIVIDAGMA